MRIMTGHSLLLALQAQLDAARELTEPPVMIIGALEDLQLRISTSMSERSTALLYHEAPANGLVSIDAARVLADRAPLLVTPAQTFQDRLDRERADTDALFDSLIHTFPPEPPPNRKARRAAARRERSRSRRA